MATAIATGKVTVKDLGKNNFGNSIVAVTLRRDDSRKKQRSCFSQDPTAALKDHESHENELILQAYDEDIGVGD